MGKRRIIIRRTRRPNLTVHKFPQPSSGAGNEKSYSCMWCFFPKQHVKARCEKCGRLGSTSYKQNEISQVFLEPDPAYIPQKNG
jgi:hypothetical protein